MSELADPRNWYAPAQNGEGYIFTDPQSGDPLNPGEVPTWLNSDPVLEMGMYELRARDTSLSVDILFHRHKHASDLGDMRQAWFEKRVARADYYATEALGQVRYQQTQNMQRATGFMDAYGAGPLTQEGLESIGNRTYLSPLSVRHIRAAYLGNTPTFNADLTRGETITEEAIWCAKKALHEEQFEHTMGLSIDEGRAAHVALVNAREWIIAARAGLELAARETFERPLDLFMTFGSGHKDLERKFRLLGSHVTSVLLLPEDGETLSLELEPMITNCAITPDDLATMRAAADPSKR
jgi:hypothetical protein